MLIVKRDMFKCSLREFRIVCIHIPGGPLFVIGCLGGINLIVQPTEISPVGFVRDIGFYIVTTIYVLWSFVDGKIDYMEFFGAIAIYAAYFIALTIHHMKNRPTENIRELRWNPEIKEPPGERLLMKYRRHILSVLCISNVSDANWFRRLFDLVTVSSGFH